MKTQRDNIFPLFVVAGCAENLIHFQSLRQLVSTGARKAFFSLSVSSTSHHPIHLLTPCLFSRILNGERKKKIPESHQSLEFQDRARGDEIHQIWRDVSEVFYTEASLCWWLCGSKIPFKLKIKSLLISKLEFVILNSSFSLFHFPILRSILHVAQDGLAYPTPTRPTSQRRNQKYGKNWITLQTWGFWSELFFEVSLLWENFFYSVLAALLGVWIVRCRRLVVSGIKSRFLWRWLEKRSGKGPIKIINRAFAWTSERFGCYLDAELGECCWNAWRSWIFFNQFYFISRHHVESNFITFTHVCSHLGVASATWQLYGMCKCRKKLMSLISLFHHDEGFFTFVERNFYIGK